VIGRLRRTLVALLRGQGPTSVSAPSANDRDGEPSERIEAARQRLKETIPPPEDD
jgi:hypothetical protein